MFENLFSYWWVFGLLTAFGVMREATTDILEPDLLWTDFSYILGKYWRGTPGHTAGVLLPYKNPPKVFQSDQAISHSPDNV